MHSKLLIFRFPGCVRIVVSSLNLSASQWSEAGDSFWWTDLPLVMEPSLNEEQLVQRPILDVLRKWGLQETWVSLLSFCDWSSLQQDKSKVWMITSEPDGASSGINYGMQRLRDALRSLPKFPPSAECPVDVQVWSLGGARDAWYSEFARVLTQEKFSDLGVLAEWKADHVRFIFQPEGGGANWRENAQEDLKKENFVRFLLNQKERMEPSSEVNKVLWHELDSLLLGPRAGAKKAAWGWHSKVMSREYPAGFCKKPGCTKVHGWRYIGSHNCSRASWGGSRFDHSSMSFVAEAPRNWEMGVILTSLPASSPYEECGLDLCAVAPLPFDPDQIVRSFPHR